MRGEDPSKNLSEKCRSEREEVLPEVNKRSMAALGMKSFGGTAASIKRGLVRPDELLRYAMSLPVAVTISGIDSLDVLRQNLKVARGFVPMTENEMQALRDRCAEVARGFTALTEKQMQALRDRCAAVAADGHLELYKSTMKYDADVGREQHGYLPKKDLPL